MRAFSKSNFIMKQEVINRTPKKKDYKFVKKVKQNMYKWHRTLGIITLIPVIFWTLSGLMHPFMAHFFKPQIANEKLEIKPIDKKHLHFSIQEVLQKNGIAFSWFLGNNHLQQIIYIPAR